MDMDPGANAADRYSAAVTETVGATLRDFALRNPALDALVPTDAHILAYDAMCEALSLDEGGLLARVDALDAPPDPSNMIESEERAQTGSLRGHYDFWFNRYGGAENPAARVLALGNLRQLVAERIFRLSYFQNGEMHHYPFLRRSPAFLASSVLVTMVTRDAWRQLQPEGQDPLAVETHYAISGGALAMRASNN